MKKSELKEFIASELVRLLNEGKLNEAVTNLERLHDGVSTSTMIGQPWFNLINSLESVYDEVKDFKGMFSSQRHGVLPNTQHARQTLDQIVKLLEEVKPIILGMDDIQRKDI